MNKEGLIKYWIILKNQSKKEIKYVEDTKEFVAHYIYDNVIGPLNEQEFKVARQKFNVPNNLNLESVVAYNNQ